MTETVLLDILQKSQVNNDEQKISGVLIYRNNQYFQLLEGREPQVRHIFEKIRQDTRHTDVEVLLDQPCEERLMPAWAMGFSQDVPMPVLEQQGFYITPDDSTSIISTMQGRAGEILRGLMGLSASSGQQQ